MKLYGTSFTRQRLRTQSEHSHSDRYFERDVEPGGFNVITVAKWRKLDRVEDTQVGPKEAHSSVLSIEE
jgi:hypothetical protein